jgi:hypothetical protein
LNGGLYDPEFTALYFQAIHDIKCRCHFAENMCETFTNHSAPNDAPKMRSVHSFVYQVLPAIFRTMVLIPPPTGS